MEHDPTAIEPDDPVPPTEPTESPDPDPDKDAEPLEDQSAPDAPAEGSSE